MLKLWSCVATSACMLLLAGAVAAEGCDSPAFHRLDFWLGKWDAYVDGVLDGRNSITSILNGCAIEENWTDVSGYEGRSWFYVDPSTSRIKQLWLTSIATQPGGIKEKIEVGGVGGPSIRLQGRLLLGGHKAQDRTTLKPLADGTVRQLIETSTDGKVWKVVYDATYRHSDP